MSPTPSDDPSPIPLAPQAFIETSSTQYPGYGPPALKQPVINSMRPVNAIDGDTSIDRAAAVLRGSTLPALPVTKRDEMIGVVSENTLADALLRGVHPFDSVESAISRSAPTVAGFESGAEALRRLGEGSDGYLLVLGTGNQVVGLVTASDLYSKQPAFPRPPMVGGLATPFGVYLTNGALGAGVPAYALMSTGALMFAAFAVGTVLAMLLSPTTSHWAEPGFWVNFWSIFPLAFLLLSMRLSPLAGIHAAEHKVVHAIERGEPLVPEVVARMPRVHPRCGTNLFVGASVFVSVYEGLTGQDDSLRLLAAAIVTFVVWRPLGSAVQWLLTTREPNRKQIDMGILSACALLEKYRLVRNPPPNPLKRLWNSGMFHVMGGFLICEGLAQGAGYLFHWQVPF